MAGDGFIGKIGKRGHSRAARVPDCRLFLLVAVFFRVVSVVLVLVMA
jgi:hypothetical protein